MTWRDTLAAVAPGLASALGGPLAGLAVRKITGTVLGKEKVDMDEDNLGKLIAGLNADGLAGLKKAEADLRVELKRLDIDLERVMADDRDSARAREIATKDRMPALIAAAVLIGFFGTLGLIAFVDIPSRAEQPLTVMLGALTALVVAIGNYYFGSSAGSKAKDKLLAGGRHG
ncbi:MAG: hypothetical protein AAF442_05355 [Pseudomonadota bacterium]